MKFDDITKRQDRHRTSRTITETAPPSSGIDIETRNFPIYVRLPKPGCRCPWTGLTRGSLNDLILGQDAPVKSVVIRQPSATRGVRLIDFTSLRLHLESLAKDQDIAALSGKETSSDE